MVIQWTQVGSAQQYTATDGGWYAILTRVSGPAWELEFTDPSNKTVLRYFETRASATADAEHRVAQSGQHGMDTTSCPACSGSTIREMVASYGQCARCRVATRRA